MSEHKRRLLSARVCPKKVLWAQKILRNNLTAAFCGWRHKGRPWWAFKETGAEGRTTIMRKRNIVVCRLLEIKCTLFLLSSDLINSGADGDIACSDLFDNVQTYILSPVLYCHMPVYHMSAQLHWTHTSELNLVIILTQYFLGPSLHAVRTEY